MTGVRQYKKKGGERNLDISYDGNGEVITAYIKNGDDAVTVNSRLLSAQLEKRKSPQGPYTLLTSYKAAA